MSDNKKKKGETLSEKLCYKRKNGFGAATKEDIKVAYDYAAGYAKFLDASKTEREATREAITLAEKAGYTPYTPGEALKAGDKKYFNNRDKSVIVFRIGRKNIEEAGVRIVAAHIDSPRIDVKQNPLYEDSGLALFKTHYYGGIKKYQWTAVPLALHGVVVLASGERVEINVGDKPSDPVFYIDDLLPHLSREQNSQPLSRAIQAEDLNVVVGGLPYPDEDESDRIKLNVLAYLNEHYGMTEEDFLSAELTFVPAFSCRDVGFDRALMGAYGHDDKVCAYPALTAVLDTEGDDTAICMLVDKEEIGSEGVTGMKCAVYEDILDAICAAMNANPATVRAHSKCLSSDVTSCYDPTFSTAFEKKNAALLSHGTAMCKFTGAGGKSGASDASAEFVGEVRKLFRENGVVWQMSELGKVDFGGGGTVAMYVAKLNIDTVDLGVPVLSMHAPYELVSKFDLYMTYKAFAAFVK